MASPDPLDIRTPPQLLTDAATAQFYTKLVRASTALRGITTLATDGVTASGAYVQAEAQATMDKVDAIINAIQGTA